MPYEWFPDLDTPTTKRHLTVWPYRSLLRRDFVIFVGATATLMALPLVALVGTAVLWGLLPFLAVSIWGLWHAINVSYRRGETREDLVITPKETRLTRTATNKSNKQWVANTHWVTAHMHPHERPVPHYITLRGGDREVEIGAFLTPQERLVLFDDLQMTLRAQ